MLLRTLGTYLILTAALTGLTASFGVAQVLIDKPIEFTSAIPAERQIYGVAYPADPNNAVTAHSVQYGQLVVETTSDLNALSVNLLPPLTSYAAGLRVRLKVTTANTGPLTLNIDGLGTMSVKKDVSLDLAAGDVPAGAMVELLFDGTNFQLMNQLTSVDCPIGFVEVNANFCIEIDERPTALFWDANKTCGDLDAVVCTWAHWYYACQKTGLGINNMTDNWEWVDDAHDHASHASLVGSGACTSNDTGPTLTAGNSNHYRCCYYK